LLEKFIGLMEYNSTHLKWYDKTVVQKFREIPKPKFVGYKV
jgi:hypothetical protein